MSGTDWAKLKLLRQGYLGETRGIADYWDSDETLALYDEYFAERIGWKWDAVLEEIFPLNIVPENVRLTDWGCGTGIAARKFLNRWNHRVTEIVLQDRSPRAEAYARRKVQTLYPNLKQAENSSHVLLVSHVLNELPPKVIPSLIEELHASDLFLWVEPGTKASAQALIEAREKLRGVFFFHGPCPHQERCGLLAPENAAHWCHHFAPTPSQIHQEKKWSEFSQRLGIDLRSLPVSFLVGSKKVIPHSPLGRVIGRPRHYKGYSTALVCNAAEVRERKWLKRTEAPLIRELKSEKFSIRCHVPN